MLEPRGFFETPSSVADFLCDWAIRSSSDRILEPCAGTGALLRSAQRRLRALGPKPKGGVIAVEKDKSFAELLRREGAIQVVPGDFLHIDPKSIRPVDVVVANPPYVRVRFLHKRHRTALIGKFREVTGRASIWAYFLLHAKRFLVHGGRLAFVLPWELLTTDYGRRALQWVALNFGSIEVLQLLWPVFESAQVSIVLLLCEGTPRKGCRIKIVRTPSSDFLKDNRKLAEARKRARASIPSRGLRVGPIGDPDIFEHCRKLGFVPLNKVASIRIGFVTGSDSFFTLSVREVRRNSIPHCCRRPILSSPKQLEGIKFDSLDSRRIRRGDGACYLLTPCDSRNEDNHAAVRAYLQRGRRLGVCKAFKCRSRKPWFQVRLTDAPDAFLTYMNFGVPRLAINGSKMSATNRLHHLYFNSSFDHDQAERFAAAFLNPFTLATVEAASRVYGGGVLKIEPGDCSHIMVPDIADPRLRTISRELSRQIDTLVRSGNEREAIEQAGSALAQALCIPGELLEFPTALYWELRIRRIQLSKTEKEKRALPL